MNDRLTHKNSYDYPIVASDLLTTPDDLRLCLSTYLLMAKVGQLSPATISNYRYMCGKFVDFCQEHGVTKPAQITSIHLGLFLQQLQLTNGPQSVTDYFKQIRPFINWLKENGQITVDPLKQVRLPKVPRKVIQPFTQEHCQRLLSLVSGETFEDKRNKALILLLLDTGLRLRECTELKWSDINYDSELVKVMGKGAKERVVRIGPKVQRALLEYQYLKIQSFPRDKTPDVWVSRHKTRYSDKECHPLTKNGIMQTIVTLGKRAGITNIRCSPHTFRHTFATMCLRNGAGEFEVQSLMGHSTLTQTRKYAASLNSEVAVQGHKKFSPVDNLKL